MVVICGGQLRQLSRARTGIMVVRYLNIVSFSSKKTKTPKIHTMRKRAIRTKSKINLVSMPNAKRFAQFRNDLAKATAVLSHCHSNAAA